MAKILIVEDDPGLSRMYQRAFHLAGHQVEMAVDGQMGLEKIDKIIPELIFLDIMMPKLNGMEVLAKLKADPETVNIPVVMMTNILSGTLPAAKQAVADKWAVKYIVKSEMTPDQILGVAQEILEESRF